MIELIQIFALMLLPSLVAILGEYLSIQLPMYDKLLDRKPFNCRPCLTFHLSWITTTLMALAFNSAPIFVLGIIYSFVVFIILYLIDKNKITK